MSLARAFQYSGSSNILSTLWPADDQAGATLTTDFFRFLSQKDASATALQKARQEWLRRSDDYHCHPYFWAGYVLIGEGGEVNIGSGDNWLSTFIFCFGLAIAIMIAGWAIGKKKGHS
ncbi:MAG: CHAT domain-containing protein [Bacteroidia bacterium]